jgi:RAB protein geranylgeranyltransferase component A
MIEQVDERVCQNLDNDKEHAERRTLVYLLGKMREIINAVNDLDLCKLNKPTREQLERIETLTKDIRSLQEDKHD